MVTDTFSFSKKLVFPLSGRVFIMYNYYIIFLRMEESMMKKTFKHTKPLIISLLALSVFTAGCQDTKKKDTSRDSGTTEAPEDTALFTIKDGEAIITKSTGHNPVCGGNGTGDYIYGGDPSVLTDGDTVYLYTGHDISTDNEVLRAVYNIPEYLCYSSGDMVNWKKEGTVFTLDTNSVGWARDSSSAWASQVIKYKDKYYLYFCTWDKTSLGKQSIGVAVSDRPTGGFKDIGKPLVQGTLTTPENSAWDDIDPTVWISTDGNGEEHRYLAWGNSKFYICELNEDMVSVKDLNGDGKITCGAKGEDADIINNQEGLDFFTEAPWLYQRQDGDGNYYGKYYLFYAYGWRERMAYAVADDPLGGPWEFGQILMLPTATSNTNHMAVFDFKGKTYFVYHNGSLPGGNGYRRSPCITELKFNDDGSINPIPETTAGINGTVYKIALKDGKEVSHDFFVNSSGDNEYPYLDIKTGTGLGMNKDNEWVITAGKADTGNEAYVSIQSENKPGLYLTANETGTITLAQDADASEETATKQTFHSVKGLDGEDGVSFESVSQPGKYISVKDGVLCLSDGNDAANSTFYISKQ